MMRPPQITRRAIAEKVQYRKWHDPPSIVWISVIVCQSKMQTRLCSENFMYCQPLPRKELTDQLVDDLVQPRSHSHTIFGRMKNAEGLVSFDMCIMSLKGRKVVERDLIERWRTGTLNSKVTGNLPHASS